jgi:hypothetical protein
MHLSLLRIYNNLSCSYFFLPVPQFVLHSIIYSKQASNMMVEDKGEREVVPVLN